MSRQTDRSGRGATAASAALLLLAFGGSGPAHATPELQTRSPRQECTGGVPACVTVGGRLDRVGPDAEREVRVQCPSRARHFWNWAAEPARQVQVSLLAPILDAHDRQVGARLALGEQGGATAGFARLYLGCSATAPTRRAPIRMRYEGFGWHPHQERWHRQPTDLE